MFSIVLPLVWNHWTSRISHCAFVIRTFFVLHLGTFSREHTVLDLSQDAFRHEWPSKMSEGTESPCKAAHTLVHYYTHTCLHLPAWDIGISSWVVVKICGKFLCCLLFAVVQRLAKRFIPGWYWFILIYVDLCWFAWWSKKMWPPLYKPRRPSFTNLHWDGKVKKQNIQNARTLAIYSKIDRGIDHDCNIMAKHWNRNDSMRIEWDSSDSFSIWATSHVANESSQST